MSHWRPYSALRGPLTWLICIVFMHPSAALAQVGSQPGDRGDIVGTIRDDKGDPLDGVSVDLSSDHADKILQTALSASNGRYSFVGIRYGAYTLVAHRNGYATKEAHEVALASRTVVLDLRLAQTAGFLLSAPGNVRGDLDSQAKAPAFAAAGVKGSTTAGGYSAAAEEEDTAAVLHGVAGLSWEDLASVDESEASVDCSEEMRLLRLTRSDPKAFDANHRLGLFYLEHGDAGQGIRYLQIAQRAEPANLRNSHDLAYAYIENSDPVDAIALLSKGAAEAPADPISDRLLAEAYLSTGDRQKSISLLQAASKLDKSEGNSYGCGVGLIIAGSPQSADSIFSTALDRRPTSARLWLGLGLAQSLEGDKKQAIQSMLRAADTDPDYAPTYAFLANLAGVSEGTDLQIGRLLKAYLATHAGTPAAHYNYAIALWNASKHNPATAAWSEIESQLTRALALNPRSVEAHYQLGIVYAGEGQYSLAVRELQAATQLDPNKPEAHYRLSQAYRRDDQKGPADRELQEFERLHAEHEEDRSAGILVTEGLNIHNVALPPCNQTKDLPDNSGPGDGASGRRE